MPNPAQTSLIVSVDELEPVQLTLFDASGKALRRIEFRVATELYTGDLPAGVYSVLLQSSRKQLTKQVVIQ